MLPLCSGGPCDKPACRKMKMVLQHYKHCAFKRKSQLGSGESLVKQDCKLCGQLIRIVALHSRTDCKVTAGVVTDLTFSCLTFSLLSMFKLLPPSHGNPCVEDLEEVALFALGVRLSFVFVRKRAEEQKDSLMKTVT